MDWCWKIVEHPYFMGWNCKNLYSVTFSQPGVTYSHNGSVALGVLRPGCLKRELESRKSWPWERPMSWSKSIAENRDAN